MIGGTGGAGRGLGSGHRWWSIGGGVYAAGTREGVSEGGFVFETQIGDETIYVHAPFLDEPGSGTRGSVFDPLALFRSYTNTDGVDAELGPVGAERPVVIGDFAQEAAKISRASNTSRGPKKWVRFLDRPPRCCGEPIL